MYIRKIFALLLALVFAACLPMTALAATGYGSGTVGFVIPYIPITSSAKPPATTESVKETVSKAIKEAVESGKSSVSIQNVASLPASTLKDLFNEAKAAGVTLVLYFDTKEGNTLTSRIYMNEKTAAKLSGTVNFSISTKATDVASTTNTFKKLFSNELAVISLGQKGSFGASVRMAVKVDLSKLDKSKLFFYVFDKTTGQYYLLKNVSYKIDSKGYLHFTTSVGGEIIITDKELSRK